MEGYKVTIRLLDPPLHEFLPNPEELMDKIYKNKNFGDPSMIIEHISQGVFRILHIKFHRTRNFSMILGTIFTYLKLSVNKEVWK